MSHYTVIGIFAVLLSCSRAICNEVSTSHKSKHPIVDLVEKVSQKKIDGALLVVNGNLNSTYLLAILDGKDDDIRAGAFEFLRFITLEKSDSPVGLAEVDPKSWGELRKTLLRRVKNDPRLKGLAAGALQAFRNDENLSEIVEAIAPLLGDSSTETVLCALITFGVYSKFENSWKAVFLSENAMRGIKGLAHDERRIDLQRQAIQICSDLLSILQQEKKNSAVPNGAKERMTW